MNVLSQSRAKQIRSLQQKKTRQETGLFTIEGAKTIFETLRSDWNCETLVCSEAFLVQLEAAEIQKKVEILVANEAQLASLGNFQTNMAAILVAKQQEEQNLPFENDRLWLIAEALNDPGNLGTLIRLADWFGLRQLLLLGPTVEWYNPKVVSATMGSFLRIQPVRASKETVLKSGRVCIAADMEGENLYGYRFPEKSVLLIGNEARGLDEQWFKEKHVQRVSIPRFGQAESLNAAMAAGIFLSHWRQQTSF